MSRVGARFDATVPAPARTPAVSQALAGRLIAKVAVSLSWTMIVPLAGVSRRQGRDRYGLIPSSKVLSMIVIGTEAEVSPAGMVAAAGTVALPVSPEARATERGAASAAGMLTVAATVPTPSVALAGSVNVNAGKVMTFEVEGLPRRSARTKRNRRR